jgi:MFS family permease
MTLASATAAPNPPPIDPLHPGSSVFRHRAFALFWAARLLSTLAVMSEAVTLGWQVYAIARQTHTVDASAFLVGMVGLAQFLPLVALTLVAGEATDRYDRKVIWIACLGVQIICDLALAVLALQPQTALAPIFLIAAVFGATRAFPAHSALAPMLVPREDLPRSLAWGSLAWQTGAVVGPVIAGAFIGLSAAAAYLAAAALYAAAALCAALIRGRTRPDHPGGSRMELIREGLVYVWTNRVVLGALSLDLFAVLLGGATALLPVFARDVLHSSAVGFGLLRAGPALGAGLTAIVLSRRPMHRHAGLWMFAGVAAFGLATIAFALSRVLMLSVLALAVLGAGDMLSVYVRQTLVQIATPDAMRGRVSAISSLFVGASNELGEFETGVAARWIGPIGAALFGGIGSLVVVGLWAKMFPTLRKADRLIED